MAFSFDSPKGGVNNRILQNIEFIFGSLNIRYSGIFIYYRRSVKLKILNDKQNGCIFISEKQD